MLDPILRPAKDVLLRPLLPLLQRIPPNTLTWVAWWVGMGCALLAATGHFRLSLLLWLANRILDGLDGLVARSTDRVTDFGGHLDLLLDFCVYAAVPIGLAVGSGHSLMPICLLLAGFYVNAASWMSLAAILEKRDLGASHTGEVTTITMPSGLIGGAETGLFYCAFLIWPRHLGLLAQTMLILVLIGIVARTRWAYSCL